ncbi:MAG: hypothetical protein IJX78_02250 [Bacilli bacterium]|nr:hypothetical protein [Bacilli bacterium]
MIQLHYKYLFSKYNLWTILIIILLYLGGLLINIFSIPINIAVASAKEMYFLNVVSLLKFVLMFLIIFLFGNAGTYHNDSYLLFLIDKRVKRIKFYVTKIFSLFSITIFLTSIFMLLFIMVGIFFSNWYIIEWQHVKFFLYLGMVSFMYGLITYNLVKFITSIFTIFLPCLIILLEESFVNEELIKLTSYLFPIIQNNHSVGLSYGIFHVILLIGCYMLIGLIKTYTLDIK